MTEMVPILLNSKYPLTIPDHRAARPKWQPENGCWEGPRTEAMHDLIGPGDVVYYVGAEEGEFPALCVTWGAQVYLIEPNPKVWSNIRAIWESNNLPTPVTFPGFASNITESLGVEPTRGWPDCAYEDIIAAHGFKELHTESQNYPQIKLDDLYEKFQEPPTVLSFDVEGSEFHVLRGAERIIDTFKPIIYASIHPEMLMLHWGEWSRDLRNWINDKGYTELMVDYQHELHCVYLPNERVGDLLPKITCTWLRSEQPFPLRFGAVQR
jgi:FkbM family methyltransferase